MLKNLVEVTKISILFFNIAVIFYIENYVYITLWLIIILLKCEDNYHRQNDVPILIKQKKNTKKEIHNNFSHNTQNIIKIKFKISIHS